MSEVHIGPSDWFLRKQAMTAHFMENLKKDLERASLPELGCEYMVSLDMLTSPEIVVRPFKRESQVPGEEPKAFFTNAEVGKLQRFFDDFFKRPSPDEKGRGFMGRPDNGWRMEDSRRAEGGKPVFTVERMYWDIPQWSVTNVRIGGFIRGDCRIVWETKTVTKQRVVCDSDEGQEELNFE